MSRDEVDPVTGQDDISDEQSRHPVAIGNTAEDGSAVLVVRRRGRGGGGASSSQPR